MAKWVRLDRKRFLHWQIAHMTACGILLRDRPVRDGSIKRPMEHCKVCDQYVEDVKQWKGEG